MLRQLYSKHARIPMLFLHGKILTCGFLCLSMMLFLGCSEEKKEETSNYNGPLFSLLSPEQSGVNFVNTVPETPRLNLLRYQYLHNGAGVSLGDVNNDGLVDLFFSANFGPNQLYINKGNLQFEEIGRAAGIGGKRGWSTGSTMVDINNDGHLDIYVSRAGGGNFKQRKNALFVNNGDLTFTEKAAEYGLADSSYSTQAAFFDYDRDGDLDMFLLNHPIEPVNGNDLAAMITKRDSLTGDKLYRNDDGHFTDISEAAGIIGNSMGFGLSVSTGDLNNDGWTDLYVCNDYLERDYLYINNQDGTFSEKAKESIRHISNFSMGSDMADFNNDGLLDIMVVDMVAEDNYRIKTNMSGMSQERFRNAVDNGFHYQYMMNTLQMNNGNGTFSEVSQLAGLSSTDWSWTPLWADFDNDGHKDLLVTNGLRKEARNNDFVTKKKKLLELMEKDPENEKTHMKKILDEMPENKIKNYIFKNEGDITFSNKQEAWGLTEASFSTGAAYADLDNDGDLDLVMSNVDHPAFIYQNNSEKINDGNFLKVKLKGTPQNESGVGARITIKSGDDFQMKEHFLNKGYLSSGESTIHFGMGKNQMVDSLWIQWPDGNTQVKTKVDVNKVIEITYKKNKTAVVASLYKNSGHKLMNEVTQNVNVGYKHQENYFDDFEKEILLPHKMSSMGPAMATADVNADGLDDFYVGGAKGGKGYLYVQKSDGTFKISSSNIWGNDSESEDVAATFFDADTDGDQDLYVVSGGNEFAIDSDKLQDRLYINDGQGNFTKSENQLPVMLTSGGTVAANDFDADGDLDLFVGGRLVPGAYPRAPRSYLLKNTNGVFEDITSNASPELMTPGLVTSSTWVDVDGDNQKDLIVAGEWMPISIFKNNGGTFKNISENLGLNDTEGWWYSMAAGDFDQDGDQDFIFGNLGLNYKYKASPEATFDVFFDDFDNNQTGDIVLTLNTENGQVPLRGRQCSSDQMPFIKEKFGTYDEFAKASITDVFGNEKLENALHLKAKTFASVYIENKGDEKWIVRSLPRLAQLSSVHGIVVKDVNNDGFLDAIMAGNLYESEVETPRNDAGNGLIITGDGAGNFKPLPTNETGFFAPKDVKNVQVISIQDKPHIVVVNNNDILQFFQILGGH